MMEFLVKLFICLVYPEHPISAGTDDKHRTDPSSGEKSSGIRESCNSVPNGQDQTPDETSENLEILNDEGRATAAVKRYGDQSKLYTPDTADSKKSLTIPSGRPAVGNTLQTLSDSDLSVDARQCAVPRKKPKDKKLKDSKQADFEKDDLDVKKDKDSEHFKKDKSRNDDDLRDFIRALVQKEFSEKTEIKFFDAAIVYDKRDFDDVVRFKNELTDIVKTSIDDDLRIELFDSEEFAQSKIMVVEDVIDRCSVVLIYLSSNFTSPELHLFTEEAIGLSRLGYNDPEFQTRRMNSQRQWVLKPVHTKSQKSRDYKTPVGLLTVNGIDWFDRSSQHTKNQIISIMKEAVRQRKQKSMEINTNNAYKDMFGSLPSKPKLGPPFNKQQRPVTKSMAQVPTTGEINPLISHPVEDAMSFPFFQRDPLLLNDYDLGQVAVQPRFQHDVTSSLRHDDRPYPIPSILHGNMAVQGKNLVTQQRNEPRSLSYEYAPYGAQMPYGGYTEQQSDTVQREAVQLSYPTYESTPGSQHGYIYQSAGLQTKGKQTPQQGQLPVLTTNQPVTMQSGLAVSYPPQIAQPRSPMRSPDVHGNPNCYLDRHVSQDALPSNSESYMRDQNRDLQSTQMSIVSKITGNLILKSNLSTDDDIEVDSLHSDIKQRASSSHMTEGQSRGTRFSHGTADDTDDSDTSSGSDSDAEVPDGRKLVKKVVNIVGCKTVQLGKGNRVKETKKKHHASEDSSKKSENQSDSTSKMVKKETSNDIPGQASHHESSVLPMNISVSDDVRSMQKRISKDLPHGKPDGYLSENMNRLSSPYAGITRNFHAETKPVNELNVNSENYPSNNMERKQSSNFHFSIDEQGNDNNDKSSSGGNVWSPDDNITEEQLFGAGSVEGDENVSNLSSRAQEAPFSLSKFVGKTNFQDMVHISLNMTSDQTTIVSPNLYSELD